MIGAQTGCTCAWARISVARRREASHLHPREVYSRVLFVCDETNAVHLCTADTCNTATVDKDTSMCCALTGNVHSKSQTILSHGWVEDEWRKGVDPRIKPVVAHAEDSKICCSLGKLVRLYQADSKDNRLESKAVLVQRIQVGIRQLLPGSQTRGLGEADTTRYGLPILRKGREVHTHVQGGQDPDLDQYPTPAFHRRTASESSSGCVTNYVLDMDACYMQSISTVYAKTAVDFICQLGKHSSFDPDDRGVQRGRHCVHHTLHAA